MRAALTISRDYNRNHFPYHKPRHISLLWAQRHANGDFAGAARHTQDINP